MADTPIRFEDGAAYERMMGTWSRLAGDVFLDWLAAPKGLSWLDIGCGNGAFTEAIMQRCGPAAVTGIDPSPGQLDYARKRAGTPGATYVQGEATNLPFADATFDAAAMALSLFFVPDPERGVAEMARVVKPGGLIAAYNWDFPGGGFPIAPIGKEMREMGFALGLPPSVDTANVERMRELWEGAKFDGVQTRSIEVRRTFESFDDLWESCMLGSSIRARLGEMSADQQAELKQRVGAKCAPDARGRITWSARANAVKGRRA